LSARAQSSGSQPGSREEVTGVPPNIELLLTFLVLLLLRVPRILGKGYAKFIFSLTGCREPKKVEKHWLRV